MFWLTLGLGLLMYLDCPFHTWTEPLTLPPPRYLEHPPQYFPPSAEGEAIRGLVRAYFANLSRNQPCENSGLFAGPCVPVVGVARGRGPEAIWRRKAEEQVRADAAEPQTPITVDATEVEPVEGALAVARVIYHNAAIKGRAVFTFTSEGGRWRIATLVFETRLPHE